MDYSLLIERYARPYRELSWSRQRLLHECLRAAIRDGTLAEGTRLVASRALAQELGIARNSVLYAYEQLASEGYVVSSRRGTLVARLGPGTIQAAAVVGAQHGLARRAMDLRPQVGAARKTVAFAPGVPALDQFPLTLWRRTLERAMRSVSAQQLHYADPAGEMPLRAAIADHVRVARGVNCQPEQVFITDGTANSLDICMRALADVGDVLWMESPGYGGAVAGARAAGLSIIPKAVDVDGVILEDADWERPPRLIYTTPSHQYPTGGVLSLRRRLALIEAARAASSWIIEDDYDSEFRHDGAPLPAMQGLTPDAPVIYLGTFSKTMFPGLRIGFMVVPAALATSFAQMRAQSSARGRVGEQLALAEFLASGQFARHVRRMRRIYRQRRDALVAALQHYLGAQVSIHSAAGGMHLALRLLEQDVDDVAISEQAWEEGIVVHALSRYAIDADPGWRGFVLGYAQVNETEVASLVARLAALIARQRSASSGRARRMGAYGAVG